MLGSSDVLPLFLGEFLVAFRKLMLHFLTLPIVEPDAPRYVSATASALVA